jgi:predicted transcriptional regulator
MPKRSRLERYFDILKAISNGETKPTRIMYKANLSWDSLQTFFESLLEQAFIQVDTVKASKRYSITPKGQRALNYYFRATRELVRADRYQRTLLTELPEPLETLPASEDDASQVVKLTGR